jgi:hypothetical protein
VILAIADPPYLGRARRWYGNGRGHGGGSGRADRHADASMWDTATAHIALLARLVADFDGWAVAGAPDSPQLYHQRAGRSGPPSSPLVW